MRAPSQDTRRKAGLGLWLVSLALMLTICGLAWKPLQHEFLARLVLREKVPSEEAFLEITESSSHPAEWLGKMWNTGRIVHRQLVIKYLGDRVAADPGLASRAGTILCEGARDADVSVRKQALAALKAVAHPRLYRLAAEQLRDSDPELRLLGLRYLRQDETGGALPLVVEMLDDPDLRVLASAESALSKWTGIDYGVRIHHAIPQNRPGRAESEVDPAALETIREGVRQRKIWWAENGGLYDRMIDQAVCSGPGFQPPLADDFELTDLSGSRVKLSDFRGKIVLLNFWTTWCTACAKEVPDLIELHGKFGDDLVILGTSLDGVPDSHGHADGRHEDEPHHHDAESTVEQHASDGATQHDPHATADKVRRFVKRAGIDYTVLLDPRNEVGSRFRGSELPTNVLIDPEGRVRRRFVGTRPPRAWERMIAELRMSVSL